MSETIFAKILNGTVEASFVYKDDIVSAFMDLHPVNPGHTLVVPNKPTAGLADLDDTTAAHMFNVARAIAAAIRRSDIDCEGVNLLLADGEAAGQEVFHVHLHVIPRRSGDGFGFTYAAHSFQMASRASLDETARKIRNAFSD
ncbi:MAG: HIT family protein [Bdellovibrionota bacterium]|nr:MAG: HIT family protein [Bdellovibrionota bacterium]